MRLVYSHLLDSDGTSNSATNSTPNSIIIPQFKDENDEECDE